MRRSFRPACSFLPALLCAGALCVSWAAGEEKRMTLDLDNESVARVGIEALSKREIESRMLNASAEMVRLFALRDRLKADGAWTPEHAAQFDERYLPAFNEELRNAIRERLMLQQAKRERLELDRAAFARRLEGVLELYRKHKLLFTPGNSVEEIRKRLRAEMLVETFRASLMDFLDAPRRPEIERYYREHPEEFRRGTGYSVRRIRVDCVRTGLDGREVVDPGAPKRAEELHAEAARDPSCFKELAAKHSDDPEDVRKKGGLLEGSDGDPFLELDDSEAPLARALRGLKPPDGLSPVFEMGRGSFAFVLLIDVRAAGIRPLDASLLEKIGKDLLQEKIRLKEEAWFHKALAENLVQRIEGGRETNFRDAFLFPDAAPTRRPADPARTRGEANP